MNAPVTIKSSSPFLDSVAPIETGLAALGRAGNWEVSVDEELNGASRWFVQIEGPAVYVYSRIDGPSTIEGWTAYLEERLSETEIVPANSSRCCEFQLSKEGECVVKFLSDREFPRRNVLAVFAPGHSRVQVTLSHEDLVCISRAAREARDELAGSGSLEALPDKG